MSTDRRTGTVTEFDAFVGLGVVRTDVGEDFPFHCVSIADGSRDIAVETRVGFSVRFHIARDEAFGIEPV